MSGQNEWTEHKIYIDKGKSKNKIITHNEDHNKPASLENADNAFNQFALL